MIKIIGIFGFLLFAISASCQIIMPHNTQCTFSEPCVYEKVYPNCTWTSQWCTWDMQFTTFHCINVPPTYTFSYNVSTQPANALPYTISAFEGNDLATDQNAMYAQTSTAFSLWASLMPISRRPIEAPTQPINGISAIDNTSGNKTFTASIVSSRLNNNCVGIYVYREDLTEQFPCFVGIFDIKIY